MSAFAQSVHVPARPLAGLLVAVGFLVGTGCDNLMLPGQHDALSLEQRPYQGHALRMDGYYADGYRASDGSAYGSVYFLYRNGAIRYVGTVPHSDRLTADAFFSRDARSHWGVFQVDSDRIAFERWYPPNKGYTAAYVRAGRILNDTTFVITASWRSVGGQRRARDETYRFYPFAPKPDSTSRFLLK